MAGQGNYEWVLVFKHDTSGGYFADDQEAQSANADQDPSTVAKYSRLDQLESMRGPDGKLHFKLVYPEVPDQVNEWKQTSNPLTSSEAVEGYEPISIAWTGQYWGGLAKSVLTGDPTLLDGSVGHQNWWYSIGSKKVFNSGIPGPSADGKDKVVKTVELYVRQPWDLVFKHDISGGYFANDQEAQSINADQDPSTVAKYSRLDQLESMRGPDGTLHFKLVYPEIPGQVNEWKQTSNPLTTSEAVDGYEPISVAWTGRNWRGLAKSVRIDDPTLLDGSVGFPAWWYSIGSKKAFSGGIPGPNVDGTDTVVKTVELYVRRSWELVFKHDISGGYFADDQEAQSINAAKDPSTVAMYSRLSELESMRGPDGKLHFKLVYPEIPGQVNEWKQTSNPLTTVEAVEGYEPISVAWTGRNWRGLAKSVRIDDPTLLDGSVGFPAWWYSIGSKKAFSGGIPGPNVDGTDTVVKTVELYISRS